MTIDPRQERGRLLAQKQDGRIRHVEGAMWFVPSDNAGGYLVNVATASCSCPDYQQHPTKCKHQWAVELVRGSSSAEPEGDAALALPQPQAPKPVRLKGRLSDFSVEEQAHLQKAIRFLRTRCGGWEALAKALRLTPKSLTHSAYGRPASARLAVRLARFAGVPLEDVLAGRYPPAGTGWSHAR